MRPRWVHATAAVLALVSLAATPPSSTTPTSEPLPSVPEEDAGTPLTLPLVPIPESCDAPAAAHVVFLGTVVDRDYRSIRYRIDQIKWGDPAPFAADRVGDRVIDVRYGLDVQYLDDGQQYLVGTIVDPDLGLLVSRVGDKIDNFGGDEVIGVSETDVDCPAFEDPARTLHPDGTVVEGSMLDPFFDARWRIAASILVPFGVACATLFVLSAFKLTVFGAVRRIFRPAR